MCRHLAYLGPPVALDELLLAPEHSLLRQSWAPRRQRHGTVNADGFGVGWYDRSRRVEPARYRRSVPMWADRSFASVAGLVTSSLIVAAVRSATPPLPVEETGAAPFTAGRWLFSHNGRVEGDVAALRRTVSALRAGGLEGNCDSEVVFALVLDHLDAGAAMGEALASVVERVPGRMNLLMADGESVAATAAGDTLFTRALDDAVVVASEPFDDDTGWDEVPDASLVTVAAGGDLRVEPLP